jgi:UDP-GlcNAc3NAcA epimerase
VKPIVRILSIVGARPQFIKAAVVSQVLRKCHVEKLVHTGQHYDTMMSEVFFDELDIARPDYNLGTGSGPHGAQTGAMLAAVEEVLLAECPDAVLVYGDTNSTLAGALAAAKLHIPIAHVEAGLRSFNRRMPEEINRLLTDRLAQWLFCPTQAAVDNLRAEGITEGVWQVGDVMADALNRNLPLAQERSDVRARLGLETESYHLATLHRPRNTDEPARLANILQALGELDWPVILPAHPRTVRAIESAELSAPTNVRIIPPVSYLDMLALEANARRILTDSGGVQKEAYLVGAPCITLREETEWVETVEAGWNQLVGADPAAIRAAASKPVPQGPRPPLFGDGKASQRIVRILTGEELNREVDV